jgi:dienelactone hydrolase
MKTLAAVALLALAPAPAAWAAVQTKEIEYKQGDTPLQGYIAWNDTAKGKVPGVIVVHEWWGHNEHARRQARRLAEAGYVGFALDMYGKGKVATHPAEAQAFVAEATKDPAVMKARFETALDLLKKDPHVDPARIGAIGYCFGGGVVLGMAREGADLAAVATFHGAIGAKTPAAPGAVKGRILVLTGADDPMVGPDVVDAFKKEMTAARANFEVVSFPGAKHSFTNPDADKAGVEGLAYNAEADQKSWALMLKAFGEALGKK